MTYVPNTLYAVATVVEDKIAAQTTVSVKSTAYVSKEIAEEEAMKMVERGEIDKFLIKEVFVNFKLPS